MAVKEKLEFGRLHGEVVVRTTGGELLVHVTLGESDGNEPEEMINVTLPELRGASLARFMKAVTQAIEKEVLA